MQGVLIHILFFFLNWLHFYVRVLNFYLRSSADRSHIPASSSRLSALTTVLFFPHCISSLSLIDFSVCLSSSSHCRALIWHQCTVWRLFFLSNSGVRQKVCSALVLLRNNSIRRGQGLILTYILTAASCSALLCCRLMKWFSGSRDTRFISTPLNHSESVFVCLFFWERKSHALLLQ